MKRSLVVASVWSLCLGSAVLVACGGDDDQSFQLGATDAGKDATGPTLGDGGSGTLDATTGDGSVGDGGGGGSSDAGDAGGGVVLGLDAGATAMTVYAGQSAALNVSVPDGDPALTYAWTVTSVPAGSAVTTASIATPTASTVSLPTDKAGTYVVTVTGTSDGGSVQGTVTITAAAAHIVYGVDVSSTTSGLGVVDSDGTNGHPIICPFDANGRGAVGAIEAVDLVEGAPGTATKVIFGGPQSADGGTLIAQLFATDTSGSCPAGGDAGASATVIYTSTVSTTAAVDINQLHPRVSPDGTKVAFVTGYVTLASGPPPFGGLPTSDKNSTVNVVGVDGSNATSLGTIIDPAANGETTFDLGPLRQPEWQDATHVGWTRAESTAAGAWNLVTSAVPPGTGDPQVFMSCTSAGGAVPGRLVFLGDGSVLGTYASSSTLPTDLVVLAPDPTTKICTVARNLTKLPSTASSVADFALSPDGKTVAYTVNATGSSVVYTAPVDASAAPLAVGTFVSSAAADGGADAGDGGTPAMNLARGLRWVGGGGQLAFTYQATDGGVTQRTIGSAVFLNGGSTVTSALAPDAGTTLTAVGSGDGASCSFGGDAPLGDGLVTGGIGLLALVRRRLRRDRKRSS